MINQPILMPKNANSGARKFWPGSYKLNSEVSVRRTQRATKRIYWVTLLKFKLDCQLKTANIIVEKLFRFILFYCWCRFFWWFLPCIWMFGLKNKINKFYVCQTIVLSSQFYACVRDNPRCDSEMDNCRVMASYVMRLDSPNELSKCSATCRRNNNIFFGKTVRQRWFFSWY